MAARMASIVLAACVLSGVGLNLRRAFVVPSGPGYSGAFLVLADTDHDSLGELIFAAEQPKRWEIWECRSLNSFELVQSDTAEYPPPPGRIDKGSFIPFDAGDIDRDGKADLVGEIRYYPRPDSFCVAVCTFESESHESHPDTLTWMCFFPNSPVGSTPSSFEDLDQDGRGEIAMPWDGGRTRLFENVADNRESLVFDQPPCGVYAFGDFDQNGWTDYNCSWYYKEYVSECIGDNRYAPVCSLTTGYFNGGDRWYGADADGNGRPEFYVSYVHCTGPAIWTYYLCLFEAPAEHQYEFRVVDSFRIHTGLPSGEVSLCVDIDGDSIQEVIWSCQSHVVVLKRSDPGCLERACVWENDFGFSLCAASDLNKNGYNEVYVGGGGKTSVLEVEALRVLHPNRAEELEAGDTCWIRWDTFTPPRCDSVSLFLLTDTVVPEGRFFWRVDTIVTGLSPGDTTFPWVVPDTTTDAAWIVAIAYGPGWQFDRSDHPFSIVPSGVAERSKRVAPGPLPEPTIVGGMLWLGPDLGHDPKSQSGSRPCPASLLDASGRVVMDLQPGPNDIRHAAPGIYFVRTAESGTRSAVRKVVIQR